MFEDVAGLSCACGHRTGLGVSRVAADDQAICNVEQMPHKCWESIWGKSSQMGSVPGIVQSLVLVESSQL